MSTKGLQPQWITSAWRITRHQCNFRGLATFSSSWILRLAIRLSERYAALIAVTLPSRRALTSRMGGWPKKRLYSRLNWLTLS